MDLHGSTHTHPTNKACMMTDDDDQSLEDCGDATKGKLGSGSPWHRVKWTDGMVKLLITAASYVCEDVPAEGCGAKRKSAVLQKKGKWKAISRVMTERGCYVSPQQCEDKFNDLNKRYKRLTDILGRGTSCKVVENPALLGLMSHLSEKAKDDVRKILSSKQLFYEEMCSYHNGNRFHLPADPALHRSLLVALGSREGEDVMGTLQEGGDEDDDGADTDEEYDTEEFSTHNKDAVSCFSKRTKDGVNYENVVFRTPASHGCGRMLMPHPQGISVDINQVIPEGSHTEWPPKQSMKPRSLQLEEQKLQIQAQMLEIQQQRFEWEQNRRKKDMELEKMRLDNEKMKIENEQMALELKRNVAD